MAAIYDFTVTAADGAPVEMGDYEGKLLLVVNVASKCGFTPQYEGLEALYRQEKERGLELIGFPCDQFGNQEPGTAAEIEEFCSLNYAVTFPMMSKIEVNGPDADPIYSYLRAEAPGEFTAETAGGLFEWVQSIRPEAIGSDEIKWNFTKFLIGRDGTVIRRYEADQTPEAIRADIEGML